MNTRFDPLNPQDAGESTTPTSAVHLLHRVLRGRYLLAAILAVALAAGGLAAGYNSTVPKYKASAFIKIDASIQGLIYEVQENQQISMFDTFVDTEAQYVTSDRTLNLAISSASPSDRWSQRLQEVGWPTGTAGISELKQTITVRRQQREAFIHVFGIHEDPQKAQLAVNAVLEAYLRLHNERMGSPSERERELTNLLESYDRRIETEQQAILAKSDPYGTPDLESWHSKKLQQVADLESSLLEIQKRIATKEDDSDDASEVFPETTPEPNYPSAQTLAALDPDLAALMRQRDLVEGEIETKAGSFGENHREMVTLRSQLESLEGRIDARVKELQLLWEAGAIGDGDDEAGLPRTELTLQQLRDLERRQTALLDAQMNELRTLNQTIATIQSHRSAIESLREARSIANDELERLRVEYPRIQRGRASIETAVTPTRAEVDKRKQYAALGGGFGFTLGLGVVIAWGFVRPSYRYLDDLEGDRLPVPVLGSLPDMGDRSTMNDDLISLNVHHMRNVLQLQAAAKGDDLGMAYLVTSGRPGDGKTSLALALAMSFAIEGRRTVLLDTDFVGRGLTHSLGMADFPGLAQLIEGEALDKCLHDTQIAHLQAMPTGPTESCKPERLSEKNLRQVLGMLRREVDFIVLDTGPLLGSLEANLAASLVDQVLLAVPRGQQPSVLRATLDRIRRLGGDCAGIVFNRASSMDLERSVSQFSFQGQSMRRHTLHDDGAPDERRSRALVHVLMGQASARANGHTPDHSGNGQVSRRRGDGPSRLDRMDVPEEERTEV